MTYGDVFPHLKTLPGYKEIAAREYVDPTGQPSPTIAAMALDFAKNVVAYAADGFRKATPEVQAARKETCLTCNYAADEARACRVCGCGGTSVASFIGLNMNEKRSWATSRCPLIQPRWEAT